MRKTKIVCTIGPASRDESSLLRLIEAGMDVARLNMSHGTLDEHREVIKTIRRLAAAHGKPVAILQDLQGPKLRLGEMKKPVFLQVGAIVTLTTDKVEGDEQLIPVDYDGFIEDVSVGSHFSLADGLVDLEVLEINGNTVMAEVQSAGEIRSRKGVHLPEGGNGLPVMTAKDEEALRMGLEMEVDWVALSFVAKASDAERPRAIMEEMGVQTPLIAKIERRPAVRAVDEILRAFDGIMVARGDLGVEVQLEKVPRIQKDIIHKANLAAKPVITATQMLLSMVSSPRPTRAEVNDVANAILDGTDAVMLSEETAIGEHPVESVEIMARIAMEAEASDEAGPPPDWSPPLSTNMAIARASRKVSAMTGAKLIVTPTSSGGTPRLVAMCKPTIPVLSISCEERIVRRLALSRGIYPVHVCETFRSVDRLFDVCIQEALTSGFVKSGDKMVITAGFPLNTPGTTNLMQILEV